MQKNMSYVCLQAESLGRDQTAGSPQALRPLANRLRALGPATSEKVGACSKKSGGDDLIRDLSVMDLGFLVSQPLAWI